MRTSPRGARDDARAIGLRHRAARRGARRSRISRYSQTRCPTHSSTFFDHLLTAPARARLTHLALPHPAGLLSAPAPRLAVLDNSPGIAAPLAPSRPLRPVTLCIANTLYASLRPAALFGALIGALKGLILVLTPDVGVRAHGPLLGALGNTGAGLETPELSFKGISDEVSLKALYKQVGSLLPNVQALRMLRLRTMTTEAAQAEEGPLHLAL